LLDYEAVLWLPGQLYAFAGGELLAYAGSFQILRIDRDLGGAVHADHVLRAHANVTGIYDRAGKAILVIPLRIAFTCRLTGHEAQLLGSHTDAHGGVGEHAVAGHANTTAAVEHDLGLVDGNHQLAIVGRFASPEDLTTYLEHPAHVAVVRDLITPVSPERARIQIADLP